MPNLFGVDIAAEIYKGFKGKLVAGTYTKKTTGTRTPSALTGGTNPTTAPGTLEGFLTSSTRTINGQTIISGEYISILGDSILPAVALEPGDTITLTGETHTFTIEELDKRDPAAALYKFKVVR